MPIEVVLGTYSPDLLKNLETIENFSSLVFDHVVSDLKLLTLSQVTKENLGKRYSDLSEIVISVQRNSDLACN